MLKVASKSQSERHNAKNAMGGAYHREGINQQFGAWHLYWHRSGRDNTILPTTAHNATMVNVAPIIVKKRLDFDLSLYTILQILSISIFEKAQITKVLASSLLTTNEPLLCKQPNLFDF